MAGYVSAVKSQLRGCDHSNAVDPEIVNSEFVIASYHRNLSIVKHKANVCLILYSAATAIASI